MNLINKIGIRYEIFIIYKRDVEPEDLCKAEFPYEFIEINKENVKILLNMFGEEKIDKFLERFTQGHKAYALTHENKAVSVVWVAFSNVYDDRTGYEVKLLNNEAYFYHGHTAVDFRSKGLGTLLRKCVFSMLYKLGTKTTVGCVRLKNYPSRRMYTKLGYRRVKMVYVFFFKGKRFEVARPLSGLEKIKSN